MTIYLTALREPNTRYAPLVDTQRWGWEKQEMNRLDTYEHMSAENYFTNPVLIINLLNDSFFLDANLVENALIISILNVLGFLLLF